MADKITPKVLTSGFASIAALNENFSDIATELNDKVLYRDTSEVNQMEVTLDMNSNKLINLTSPQNNTDAARLQDIVDGVATTDTVLPLPTAQEGKYLGASGGLFVFQDTSNLDWVQTGMAGVVRSVDAKLKDQLATPEDFGAVGDGIVDDTLAVQAALDSGSVLCKKLYAVTGVNSTNYLTMLPSSKFIYIGAQNGICLTVNADFGDLYVDGGLNDVTGVTIRTDGVKGDNVFVERITASTTSSTSIYPFSTSGVKNIYVKTVRTFNTKNTGQSNDSFPQAVALINFSDDVQIDNIFCEDGASGLAANSGEHFIGTVRCKNMQDNGIYGLGADLHIENFIYEGNEEPYVILGGRHVIGSITTIGKCGSVLGIQGSDDIFVGVINVLDDGAGSETASKVLTARQNATNIGRIWIGEIRGHLRGSGIINTENAASVEYLQIDNIDILIDFNDVIPGGWSKSGWWDMPTTDQLAIKNVTIRIRDVADVLTNDDIFFMIHKSAITKQSFLENIDIYFEDSAGLPHPNLPQCRIATPSEFLDVKGARWQTNIGPNAREAIYFSGIRDSATSIPQAGFWKQGQILWHSAPSSASPFAFMCTVTGTPGTWISLNAP